MLNKAGLKTLGLGMKGYGARNVMGLSMFAGGGMMAGMGQASANRNGNTAMNGAARVAGAGLIIVPKSLGSPAAC